MRTLAALSLAALTTGCKLTNDTVLVAMLVESPAPPADLGLVGATQTTAAQVFLGQTSVSSPSAGDVKPISGATVQLYDNGALVTAAVFTENPPGYYQATGDFYVPAHTYRLVARVGSDEYWGEVQNAPSSPSLGVPGLNSGTKIAAYTNYSDTGAFPNPYPITRVCPGGLCDVAFYGVWTVTGTSLAADPNCTNAPQDAAALLQLAFVSDLDWRAPTFSVSKPTCFPEPNPYPGAYVLGLTALKRGTTSGNTSIASAALAGTSDGAGVTVALP
jgi:hypothetical protein